MGIAKEAERGEVEVTIDPPEELPDNLPYKIGIRGEPHVV